MTMSNVLAFLNELRSLGIQISIVDAQLSVKAPRGVLTEKLKQELRDRKQEVMAFLQKANQAVLPHR